ncbi:hypothetical protein BDF19DRAFT_425165 [Syncephalis fuscata]|nr:hypothetical protein BDF19DRAFT_425165 [Syncephalis fuscata]
MLQDLIANVREQLSRSGEWAPLNANDFATKSRSIAANYLAQQVIALTQQSDQTVSATRRNIDALEKELDRNLHDVVSRVQRAGRNNDAKKAIAEADKNRLIMYVRATLARIERDARDGYSAIQEMRDDTSDQIQQYHSLTGQQQRVQLPESNSLDARFDGLSQRVMQQINQAEEWARRRYEVSRKMRHRAELAMEGDLSEFVDSLRGWLDMAHQLAEQHHEQMMTESRVLGNELVSQFDPYYSVLQKGEQPVASLLASLPNKQKDSQSHQQQYYHYRRLPQSDKSSTILGNTVQSWWHWFIGDQADSYMGQNRHALSTKTAAQLAREQLAFAHNESAAMLWPLSTLHDAVSHARSQIEAVYDRWIHHEPEHALWHKQHHAYDRIKDGHGYHPLLNKADEPPAPQHRYRPSLSGQFGYQYLPSTVQNTMDELPLTMMYGTGLLILMAIFIGLKRQKERIAHKTVITTIDEANVYERPARMVTRSMQEDTYCETSQDKDQATAEPLRENLLRRTASTSSISVPSSSLTGRVYANANALVNATDTLFHMVYTLPVALPLLGILEYVGYTPWVLHALYISFTVGQVCQAMRDAITHKGRCWSDVGEATTIGVIVLASLFSFYTSLSGQPLV